MLGVLISYEGGSDHQIFLEFSEFYCIEKKSVQGICQLHLMRYIFFIFLAKLVKRWFYSLPELPVISGILFI